MYITHLEVSLNQTDEDGLLALELKKHPVNLNKGASGSAVHLWYKEGESSPITRLQFSFNAEMCKGLKSAGYHQIHKNLAVLGGGEIYLWYYSGSSVYDIPIKSMDLSHDNDAQKFKHGWEQMPFERNRHTGGHMSYLWLQREKQVYVCDITATDSWKKDQDFFQKGYIRVDESTNRGAGGATVFIWYRLTTDPKEALCDLKISNSDKVLENCSSSVWDLVKQDLNKRDKGYEVFLWYKKVSPIKTITLIFSVDLVGPFLSAGLHVIDKCLNSGNSSPTWPPTQMFLCFYKKA